MEYYGFDVSQYQGNIDWNKIPDKYSFAIIRAGFGVTEKSNQTDTKFNRNIQGALDRGLNVGCYWFLYALNEKDAVKNAEAFLRVIEPYKGKIKLPLWLDVEGDSIRYMRSCGVEPSKALVTKMAVAFMERIKQAGYATGFYSDNSFINTYLDTSQVVNKYDMWFAYWVSSFSPSYCIRPLCKVWQHTNSGSVPGISGRVDMNYMKIDYPEVIRAAGLNHLTQVENPVDNVENQEPEETFIERREYEYCTIYEDDSRIMIISKDANINFIAKKGKRIS